MGRQPVRDASPIEKLDHKEPLTLVLEVVENPRDVGVPQLRLKTRFAVKALSKRLLGFETGRQNLYGRGRSQGRVPGLVDRSHASTTQLTLKDPATDPPTKHACSIPLSSRTWECSMRSASGTRGPKFCEVNVVERSCESHSGCRRNVRYPAEERCRPVQADNFSTEPPTSAAAGSMAA